MSCGASIWGLYVLMAASTPNDLTVRYDATYTEAGRIGQQQMDLGFLRQQLSLEAGIDAFSFGLEYRQTSNIRDLVPAARPEHGLMVVAGYHQTLASFLRFEGRARVAVTRASADQPLYGADTDLLLSLVAFDVDGWGSISAPWFPSLQVAVIGNRFGRVQLIAGAGIWWQGIGLYATGFYSLNGIADPMDPTQQTGATFAEIQNAGLSAALSYDLEFEDFAWRFEVRRDIGIRNAGHGTVGAVQLRVFFESTP